MNHVELYQRDGYYEIDISDSNSFETIFDITLRIQQQHTAWGTTHKLRFLIQVSDSRQFSLAHVIRRTRRDHIYWKHPTRTAVLFVNPSTARFVINLVGSMGLSFGEVRAFSPKEREQAIQWLMEDATL